MASIPIPQHKNMNAWRHGREIYVEKLEERKKEKEKEAEKEAALAQQAALFEAENKEQKTFKREMTPDFKLGKIRFWRPNCFFKRDQLCCRASTSLDSFPSINPQFLPN